MCAFMCMTLALVGGSYLFFILIIDTVPTPTYPVLVHGSMGIEYPDARILFVPDIMLGRRVETIALTNGFDYSFKGMSSLFQSHDLVVGNFEGVVPRTHIPTPELTTRFSIRHEFMEELHAQGFDVLSLANNHALDFGEDGYRETTETCKRYELTCVGHPIRIDENSVTYHTIGDTRIGILMLHALYGVESQNELLSLVRTMSEKSDVQVVFVHWGQEYASIHSVREELLAHALIDAGSDAVIGHHPHVIQDLELYQGKPIFYSLGNFIFDQYFSDAVQRGYAISLVVSDETIQYVLIPYESSSEPSQPNFLSLNEREHFYAYMLPHERFTPTAYMTGTLTIPRR